jgi:hypothetical protein
MGRQELALFDGVLEHLERGGGDAGWEEVWGRGR